MKSFLFYTLIYLFLCLRHQLLADDDLGPLYDLLIDDPPEIRHAIGALVYDHLIAQKFTSSQSSRRGFDLIEIYLILAVIVCLEKVTMVLLIVLGDGNNSSEVHLGRMLQILREFSTDPILSIYVVDDVWEYMNAMKVC